ncbi:PaaI family thioesterase [Acidisphaera sp. S103]|uniref:PaaI family thioesterase n=1 Tax=Acidisphaera sp. S103 TaxID=1747223 RepID=UPI00131DB2FB|nr:PaaI family thioesterase [Acidisphaera sp. S103]
MSTASDTQNLLPAAPLSAEAKATLSGLDQVRGIRDGSLPLAPMHELMNMRLTEVEDGLVVFTASPEEKHYNPGGTVHGAFSAAMLDSAMGLSVLTKLGAGVGHTTLEFKVNLVRPMSAQIGEVRCEGRVVHCGRNIATAEGRLLTSEGKIIAHGNTTCMIFPAAKTSNNRQNS